MKVKIIPHHNTKPESILNVFFLLICLFRFILIYFAIIFLKIENPVPVNPEIDSKIEFKKVT